MTVDRRIELGVSVPDFGAGLKSGTGQGQRQEADAQAREQFEKALARDAEKAPAVPGSPVQAPFSLFASAAPHVVSAPVAADPAVGQRIADAAERLMVEDGSHGNRQVRIELKDDVLPGVTVAIQECEGRLQVDFICAVESSRLKLNAAAPAQAQTLAQRLRRDVLLRVQTDDEADPCLLEVAASP